MRILVTGNMGYVGPGVVARLRETYPDAEIIGIDNGYFGHCLTTLDMFPERRLSQQWYMDTRDITADQLQDVDAIVHLAAISNDPMGKAFEEVTADVNHASGIALARRARDAGVGSFVFASSCSVYGFAEGEARNEDSELNPLTAYAHSKINTERDTEPLADDDFLVTCLRFPTACGMSDRVRLDLVLNDFVASAVATGKITVLSDGSPWRPLIDTKDMARAIDWGIGRDRDTGGPFVSINAGRTKWNYRVKELAEAVQSHMPGVEVDINTNAAPDKRSYRVDFTRYEDLAPDHQPQVDLDQSIVELKDGLEAIGFGDANFRESHLIRLNMLNDLRSKGLLDEHLRWR